MYISLEKDLSADVTVAGNYKNIIKTVQTFGYASEYDDVIAAYWSIAEFATCLTVVVF